MYVESLSRLLNQAKYRRDIKVLCLIRGGQPVNQLSFAEDSFIFCNAYT